MTPSRITAWRFWPHLLVALTVLVRLWHVWWSAKNPTFWSPAVDPGWYDRYAQAIVNGDWGPFPFFRAPLYPAFLAGVYAIFGRDLVMARMLNIVFQAFAAWGIFKVGASYFSRAFGIISALFFALNGACIFYGGELVSVSLEILASVLVAWATLRLMREQSWSAVATCGLAWGTAAIVRPNFLMVAPVALVWLLMLLKKHGSWQRVLPLGLSWALGLFLPIMPVTAVNLIKGHEWVLIATQGGVNFWIGNNPESTGILSVLPGYGNTWLMEDAELEAERELGHEVGQGELSAFYFSKGKAFLQEHPWLGLRLMIRKTLLFFNRFEISNNKHIAYFSSLTPGLPWLIYLNFGVLVPLALVGFWSLRNQTSTLLLGSLILVYALSVVLFFITTRFRLPAVPWLTWLAALGVTALVEAMRVRPFPTTRAVLFVCGLVLVNLNLWNLAEAPVGWARFMEGNAYMNQNQADSARVCFRDAIQDNEAVARARLNLGVLAYREHHLAEAQNEYQLALAEDQRNPEAWNNLGIVREESGDTLGALEAYQRSLAARPLSRDVKHNLAGLHFRIGIRTLKADDFTRAVAHFDTCLSLEPSAIAWYNRAVALGRMGRTAEAVTDLQTALRMDASLLEAKRLLQQLVNSQQN